MMGGQTMGDTRGRPMDRRGFCRSLVGGAAALAAGSARGARPPSGPNILFITTDDLGPQLGCYGDTIARTPNLDAFARDGVRFTCAYVTQASCSPSRSSMFTGLYPHQNGQIGLAHLGYSMREGLATLPALLKQAGYFNGVIGKVHVNPGASIPFEFKGTPHGKTRDVRQVASSAAEFFDRAGDRPFFLMANYFDPHRPLVEQVKGVPARPYGPDDVEPFGFLAGVDTQKVRREVAGYYDCVARIDVGIGLLMQELRRSGRYEDTLVIFIGDHGPPFTRGKTTCYEAGLHIPCIAHWPGLSADGQVSDALVSTVDIMPTILHAVGIPIPLGLAGRSLLPLIQGHAPPWRETLCAEYTTHHPGGYFPRRSIRDRSHKLIANLTPDRPNPIKNVDGCAAFAASQQAAYAGTLTRRVMDRHARPPAIELYDLQADPHELDNLAGRAEVSHIQDRLTQALHQWRRETDDPLLDPRELARLTALHDENKGKRNIELPSREE